MLRTNTLLLTFALVAVFAACGAVESEGQAAPPPAGASTDTSPPTMPTNVIATAGTNEISLTWNASTDNVGVTGYVVRRGGVPVATTAARSYIDTGLQGNTPYTYTISAVDAATNPSPQTTGVVATTFASGTPSALAAAAAALAPGTFMVLPTTGFNSGGILEVGSAAPITQYSDKGVWDPSRRRFYFEGGFNQSSNTPNLNRFLVYSDSTNSWTTSVNPSPCGTQTCPLGHAYEHNAINPATGEVYFRPYSSKQVYRFDPTSSAWSPIAAMPLANVQVAGALEWFPDRNELVFVDGDFGIWAYTPSNNQWRKVGDTGGPTGVRPMNSYHNIAHYNPVHHVMLLGGGKIYKYASDGTLTALNTPPLPMEVAKTLVTVAPQSGKYVVLANGNLFYEYDISNDTWAQKDAATMVPVWGGGTAGAPNNQVFDVIAAPVSSYGVIMYVKYDFGSSKVYIYKPN